MAGVTNLMQTLLAKLLVGDGSAVPLSAANAFIGVGDGTTSFVATQTDLLGVNKLRKGMDSGFPQRTGNVLTFRATYDTDEANFTWAEWGLFNDVSTAALMCRKVEALGTKTSAQRWELTIDLTLSVV